MFELFLVMIALSSPILIIIFVRHYFKYKTVIDHKLLVLQKENDKEASIVSQKALESLLQRVIILERIITDSKNDLRLKIEEL